MPGCDQRPLAVIPLKVCIYPGRSCRGPAGTARVTFAPKILVGHAGSGLHIHTLAMKDGHNMMVEGDDLSDTARRIIAGFLELAGHRRIIRRHKIFKDPGGTGCLHIPRADQILDRHGDSG